MSKIVCLGDAHGSFKPLRAVANSLKQIKAVDENDVVICLGDFGGNFFFNQRDDQYKEKLQHYNMTYFVIRGNHEERPSICMEKYPDKWHIEEFWGNSVYVENDYPFIKYALDIPAKYEIPTAQGESLQTLVLPGAYSVDKYHRIANGWSWFSQEQLNDEEMAAGTDLALSQSWDLVLSHTCPICYEPTDLFLSVVDQSTVNKTMERWLGGLEYQMSYTLWCWGHYHANRVYPHFNSSDRLMLFNDCYFDVYKYFCGNYKLINCLTTTSEDARIQNLDKAFK